MANLDELIGKFTEQQEAARLSNEQRYAQALEIYDKIISQYQPEGGYLKGAEAELERVKGRTVASETQDLVSSGLFGTSTRAGLGQRWEAEVGMPARLKLEDIRMERLAQALGGKASAIQAREDIGPDYATVAQLSAAAANQPQSIRRSFSGGGQLSSTRPGITPSSGPTDIWGNPVTAGSGYTAPLGKHKYQYVRGPSGMSQEGMKLSRQKGTTYMGESMWRIPLVQDIFGAMSGYASQAGAFVNQPTLAQPKPTKYSYGFPTYRA